MRIVRSWLFCAAARYVSPDSTWSAQRRKKRTAKTKRTIAPSTPRRSAICGVIRYGPSTPGVRGMKRVRFGGMRVTVAINAPPGDVAVLLPSEKRPRLRTQTASISRRYGRGRRLQRGSALQQAEVRMTLRRGALVRAELDFHRGPGAGPREDPAAERIHRDGEDEVQDDLRGQGVDQAVLGRDRVTEQVMHPEVAQRVEDRDDGDRQERRMRAVPAGRLAVAADPVAGERQEQRARAERLQVRGVDEEPGVEACDRAEDRASQESDGRKRDEHEVGRAAARLDAREDRALEDHGREEDDAGLQDVGEHVSGPGPWARGSRPSSARRSRPAARSARTGRCRRPTGSWTSPSRSGCPSGRATGASPTAGQP